MTSTNDSVELLVDHPPIKAGSYGRIIAFSDAKRELVATFTNNVLLALPYDDVRIIDRSGHLAWTDDDNLIIYDKDGNRIHD